MFSPLDTIELSQRTLHLSLILIQSQSFLIVTLLTQQHLKMRKLNISDRSGSKINHHESFCSITISTVMYVC